MSRGRGKKTNPLALPKPRQTNAQGLPQVKMNPELFSLNKLTKALALGDYVEWEKELASAQEKLGSSWIPKLANLVIDGTKWRNASSINSYTGDPKFELVNCELENVLFKNIKAGVMVIRDSKLDNVEFKQSELRNFIVRNNVISNFSLNDCKCQLAWLTYLTGDGFKLDNVQLDISRDSTL